MRNAFIKAVSATLVLSVALSAASCGEKPGNSSREIRKISEDTPWFEAGTITVDSGADPDKEVEYCYQHFAGSDEKLLVVFTQGRYREPPRNEIDWDTYNYNEANFAVIAVIDRDTDSVVNTINLTNGIDKGLTSFEHVDTASYMNGKVTVKTTSKERDYDPLTGELLDTRSVNGSYGAISQYFMVGDYVVDVEKNFDDYGNIGSNLNIKTPDGKTETIELKEMDSTIYIQAVLAINDTTAAVPVDTGKGYKVYELDLTTCELTGADLKDYEWLDMDNLGISFTGSDGLVYYTASDGIYRIDAGKKTNGKIFDYGWCGINRGIIENLELAECSEDSIILVGQSEHPSLYDGGRSDFEIIELKRAEKNPHAGKIILELYAPWIEEDVGEAITRFNETNKKFFIETADRYNDASYNDSTADFRHMDKDDMDIYYLNTATGLSNALAMDILNGEGPDILINTSKYGQLNNPDYLADLTPYIGKSEPGTYFDNIIEGAKTDGAIYQLPVSFIIEGIYTDSSEAGSSGTGFTLEEYNRFVKDSLNGTDLIVSGQAVYFAKLFNTMRDKFIKDGRADLTGPEFAELAEYVKENVPEEASSYNDIPWEVYNYAMYEPCYGIGGFLGSKTSFIKDPVILGIPSLDGRGPMFTSQCSVAISAQATGIDACGEFVRILLSDEIQTELAMNDNFVINRSAFRNAGKAAIEYYNNGGNQFANGSGVYVEGEKYSEKNIEKIEKVIGSCSCMSNEDSAISIILIEEMPAYFLGQKDLSKVISIAQNRVQKVLDERG